MAAIKLLTPVGGIQRLIGAQVKRLFITAMTIDHSSSHMLHLYTFAQNLHPRVTDPKSRRCQGMSPRVQLTNVTGYR